MSRHHRTKRKGKQQRKNLVEFIRNRDREICQICQIDCKELLEYIKKLNVVKAFKEAKFYGIPEMRLAQSVSSPTGRLWDTDHILPIADKGQTNGANLRTLCLACHRKINKEREVELAKRNSSA